MASTDYIPHELLKSLLEMIRMTDDVDVGGYRREVGSRLGTGTGQESRIGPKMLGEDASVFCQRPCFFPHLGVRTRMSGGVRGGG